MAATVKDWGGSALCNSKGAAGDGDGVVVER